MTQRLVIIGQGYVGLPLALRAVECGYDVVGLETDADRAMRLRAADSYVEDISDAALRQALSTGRYLPTTHYSAARDFDFAIITVPTPLRDGSPDLTYIRESARALAPYIRPGSTVVLESTTYPGTTEDLVRPLLEQGSGLRAGPDFHLGYSPERIDPGNPVWNLMNTPKIVSGLDEPSRKAIQHLYDTLVDQTVAVSGIREAEMTKLLENTFRHVNIALINELAVLAHELDVDIWESVDAAATKPFGFMRFNPGPGVGGHCLPVDPSYLSWEVKRSLGKSFRFVELANEINSQMPAYVVQRTAQALNQHSKSLNGAEVLLIGLAYKRNSGDCRESPAIRVAGLLHQRGARVFAVDPWVERDRVPSFVDLVALDRARVRAADIVVVLTDHDDIEYGILAEAPLVFDTRDRVRLENVQAL